MGCDDQLLGGFTKDMVGNQRRLDHVGIRVREPRARLQWYAEKLGFVREVLLRRARIARSREREPHRRRAWARLCRPCMADPYGALAFCAPRTFTPCDQLRGHRPALLAAPRSPSAAGRRLPTEKIIFPPASAAGRLLRRRRRC